VLFLHERGVVHRDLKPENIMYTDKKHDNIKIIDFGESVFLEYQTKINELSGSVC